MRTHRPLISNKLLKVTVQGLRQTVWSSQNPTKPCSEMLRRLEIANMAAMEVKFSVDARDKMLCGIDILANVVRATLGPKGRNLRGSLCAD